MDINNGLKFVIVMQVSIVNVLRMPACFDIAFCTNHALINWKTRLGEGLFELMGHQLFH
jgi:hypothetical protein